MAKVLTKIASEIALDADPTRTQVVCRNHLVEYFPRDNELPNLLSNYEKPFIEMTIKLSIYITNMQNADSLN